MKISCHYSIENLKPNLIGTRFRLVLSKKGSFKSFGNGWYNGVGDFYLLFFDTHLNCSFAYNFNPKGSESLGGNLFGFEIKENNEIKRYDEIGYEFSISGDWENYEVIKILGYGEKSKIVISDLSLLEHWYKKSSNGVPKQLIIDKKTIDFVAIELSSKKWIYICSGGEGYYSIYFNKNERPKAFIKEMLYEENEQIIELLELLE